MRWWTSGPGPRVLWLRTGQMQTPNFTAHHVNVTTKVSSSKIKYLRYNKSSLLHFTHLSRLGHRRHMLMLPDICRTLLIFQYYDQPSVMQAAWIISVHLEEAWLFETSPALGLLGVGGSKNTISQVVSHELEIAKHSFPVRLLYCPSNPTPAYLLHPPLPYLQRYTAHSVSWQKAAFPPTWWRNLPEWKKRRRKRERREGEKNLPTDLDTDTWPTYPFPRPRPSPRRAPTVIRRCFHNVLPSNLFWSVLRGPVNWMANGEKMWQRHLGGAVLASCHEAGDGAPYPPPAEPLHKRLN